MSLGFSESDDTSPLVSGIGQYSSFGFPRVSDDIVPFVPLSLLCLGARKLLLSDSTTYSTLLLQVMINYISCIFPGIRNGYQHRSYMRYFLITPLIGARKIPMYKAVNSKSSTLFYSSDSYIVCRASSSR